MTIPIANVMPTKSESPFRKKMYAPIPKSARADTITVVTMMQKLCFLNFVFLLSIFPAKNSYAALLVEDIVLDSFQAK